MPASYPSSVKTFTTRSNGQTIDAAHVNDLQLEVTAIETDLIAGLSPSRGGTGLLSYAVGDILYASASGTLAKLADVATGQVLASGGVATAPAYTASPTLTAVTAATVTSTGQVVISGASAGQIVFPATQNASSNANTLDDYEEGTWTPVIGGSGGTSGQTYTYQVGRYVKIGKLVTAYFDASASNKGTITTNAQIQGLPFTSENTTNQNVSGAIGMWNTGAGGTALVVVSLLMAANGTAIDLMGAGSATTAPVNLTTANFDTAIRFAGSITYVATA